MWGLANNFMNCGTPTFIILIYWQCKLSSSYKNSCWSFLQDAKVSGQAIHRKTLEWNKLHHLLNLHGFFLQKLSKLQRPWNSSFHNTSVTQIKFFSTGNHCTVSWVLREHTTYMCTENHFATVLRHNFDFCFKKSKTFSWKHLITIQMSQQSQL